MPFSGSDGLVMADLDLDGIDDIVSVHESDSNYDSTIPGETPEAMGHVRIAFGSEDPDKWVNITLAEGVEASAAEDAAIADVNGDGFPDIMVAAELSHLIYFQNPGENFRTQAWERLILPMTQGRGSYIRVFLADLDGDGYDDVDCCGLIDESEFLDADGEPLTKIPMCLWWNKSFTGMSVMDDNVDAKVFVYQHLWGTGSFNSTMDCIDDHQSYRRARFWSLDGQFLDLSLIHISEPTRPY